MRGRKPKPTHLKAIPGNPGKRPLNQAEPRPGIAIPDCPPELGPSAQREWQRLVGELAKLNLLTHLDRAALAFLASDCLAAPSWVSERLRLHRSGEEAVASAVLPHPPAEKVAWADHLLLFPRRLPGLPASSAVMKTDDPIPRLPSRR